MGLADTIEMMTSSDYKERFKAEYHQVFIRYTKLKDIIERYDNGTLGFQPTCPMHLYDKQLKCMRDYINILETRAFLENVDIEEN